jgi:hypothetical protein
MLFGGAVVQRARGRGAGEPQAHGNEAVHTAAATGVATPASALPHREAIQRSFGRHDVSSIQAHTGDVAAVSARDMGASAYATGNHVVFGEAPDLHTAAHEAAHVIQQRDGVHLKGGVGEAGDAYERHADAVADLVVAGGSTEALLDQHAGPRGASGTAVQRSLKHAQAVSSGQKQTIDAMLAPPPSSGHRGDIKRYVAHAESMLDHVITASYKNSVASLHGRKQLDQQDDVAPVAEEAQDLVTRVYGNLVNVASVTTARSSQLHNYKLTDNLHDIQKLGTDPEAGRDYLRNIMTLISDGNETLMSIYGIDLGREDNREGFFKLRDTFYNKYPSELGVIVAAGPGQEDPRTGEVYLPMSAKEDTMGNWYFESLQTMIHEYLHVLTHPLFRSAAERQPETGKKILIEGFCDHFAMAAWAQWTGSGPGWLRPYAQASVAKQIAQVVGDDNCRAAYFLGHVELLGLGSWTVHAPGGSGVHHVLPNDTVESICAQYEIIPQTLKELNPERSGEYWQKFAIAAAAHQYIAGTQTLKVPSANRL